MSEAIISDKDKLFIFKFWEALIKRFEVKRKISTAFHSRTNEQSKRINQTIEQYFRAYVSIEQNDWTNLLFTVQLALNNCTSAAIEELSFLLNYVRHSVLSNDYENNKNLTFTEFVKDIVRIKNRVMKKMKKRKEIINKNENIYNLNVKDKVYMKTTNIDLEEESKKLVKTVEESFKITRNIKERTFELDLSKRINIFSVFEESLLIKTDFQKKIQNIWNRKNRKDEYTVEQIINNRIMNQKLEYFIKWKDYNETENTWESLQNLVHCKIILRKYYRKKKEDSVRIKDV